MADSSNIMSSEEEENLFEHHSFKADPGQSQLRIDKFLFDRLENTSRNKIQQVISTGNVLVNGKEIKSNYKVKPLDEISVVLPYPPKETELIPEDIPLEIMFEDEHIVVVNKPAGLVVHPGYGNNSGTLVNALLYHFGNLPSNSDLDYRPGLVHRLDKDTSGVMVIAKSDLALSHLAKQFFDRTIDRRYNALIWGLPKEEKGTITGNIGRNAKDRKVMDVFDPESEIGKHAVTHYSLIRSLQYISLVECKLETGRTHQIRAHMKHLGHPLFNDEGYGGTKVLKGLPTANYKRFIENCFELIPGQALHAKTLELEHPKTGEKMFFESPLPEGFQKIIERFEKADLNRKS